MKATLEITGGSELPRTLTLEEGSTTTVGRADTNVIVLNHANISRNHLAIRVDARGAEITDLGSVNGTSVNGVKMAPNAWQPLYAGDRIQVGPFQLGYDQEADSDATVVVQRSAFTPPPAPAPPV